jgi:hypothetical protein
VWSKQPGRNAPVNPENLVLELGVPNAAQRFIERLRRLVGRRLCQHNPQRARGTGVIVSRPEEKASCIVTRASGFSVVLTPYGSLNQSRRLAKEAAPSLRPLTAR